ncbi:YwqJ-related putative deaminase [Streptomyces sp. R-74717]|uniref:YwqJ-related putative deaminase n=1 Tax=Streptomyces sp. R-74717 TaxID=2969820 RepID=UPI0039B4EC38
MSGTAPVDPVGIPVFTGDLALLDTKVTALSGSGAKIATAAGDVHTSFGGLSAFYKAPEAEQLFATTKPVADTGLTLSSDLCVIAGALGTYSDDAYPLVEKLKELKREAVAFRVKVDGDDEWREDGDLVEENNHRRNEIAEVWAAFQEVERACHAKIVALVGGKALKTNDGSTKEGMYGYDAEALKQAKSLPWGDAVEESTPWWQVWEHAYDFGKGFVVDGVWGTIKGLGTLFGVDGWDAAKQAWTGLAKLATGVAIAIIPGVNAAFWALPDDKLPSWIRDSRTAMKETGKALVAWDQWGNNPSRAAGAVTFNVLTTVFTGGTGGAVAGAGKAGMAAKALSFAGKTGRIVDPMTYVFKGAGAGLTKISDVLAGLKGLGRVEFPPLPDNIITLPEGAVRLPDGTIHLPQGATIPDGAVTLPNGTVKLPDGAVALPEGTIKSPFDEGAPYMDRDGNLYNEDGSIAQHANQAGKNPRVETPAPVREPALVNAGIHAGENAGHVIRNGDRLGNDLGDIGRAGEDIPGGGPAGNAGNHLPGSGANHMPGGGVRDNIPSNHLDNSAPSHNSGHNAPASHTETPGTGTAAGHGPTAGHEPPAHRAGGRGDGPSGPHDPTPAHLNDYTPNSHADEGLPHDDGARHPDGEHSSDGSNHHNGDGPDGQPQGTPVDPQPNWHGQSADQMRHYRRPALDVSHLPLQDQLSVLERESAALADDALDATPGAAHPGQNQLNSGCAGSFLHDNVIATHSSTTKMHGQKLPKTHQVLDGILKDVGDKLDAAGMKKGFGHGKCAEVSLISDRLHELDPTGSSIRTIDDAKKVLEGGVMHTRQIGNVYDRVTGELERSHGDFLAPCYTCRHVLPQLGIHVHS